MSGPEPVVCVYCGCPDLMAPVEPLEAGGAVICGACGGLHVAYWREEGEASASASSSSRITPAIRRPRPDEALALRQVPAVAVALAAYDDAYLQATLEDAARLRKRTRRVRRGELGTWTAKGPDA